MSKKAEVEIVIVVPNEDCPVHGKKAREAEAVRSKPTTDAYRAGWESIFGARQEVGKA